MKRPITEKDPATGKRFKTTRAKMLHQSIGSTCISEAEYELIGMLQDIRRAEASKEGYAEFQAWSMLRMQVAEHLSDPVNPSRIDEHPSLLIAAAAVARWIRDHQEGGKADV